ncbi:MAG: hypothetical protein WDW38_009011 [Sanguina aurantia]
MFLVSAFGEGDAQVLLLFLVPLYVLEGLTLPCLRDGQLTVFISYDLLLENPDARKREGMEPPLLPDTAAESGAAPGFKRQRVEGVAEAGPLLGLRRDPRRQDPPATASSPLGTSSCLPGGALSVLASLLEGGRFKVYIYSDDQLSDAQASALTLSGTSHTLVTTARAMHILGVDPSQEVVHEANLTVVLCTKESLFKNTRNQVILESITVQASGLWVGGGEGQVERSLIPVLLSALGDKVLGANADPKTWGGSTQPDVTVSTDPVRGTLKMSPVVATVAKQVTVLAGFVREGRIKPSCQLGARVQTPSPALTGGQLWNQKLTVRGAHAMAHPAPDRPVSAKDSNASSHTGAQGPYARRVTYPGKEPRDPGPRTPPADLEPNSEVLPAATLPHPHNSHPGGTNDWLVDAVQESSENRRRARRNNSPASSAEMPLLHPRPPAPRPYSGPAPWSGNGYHIRSGRSSHVGQPHPPPAPAPASATHLPRHPGCRTPPPRPHQPATRPPPRPGPVPGSVPPGLARDPQQPRDDMARQALPPPSPSDGGGPPAICAPPTSLTSHQPPDAPGSGLGDLVAGRSTQVDRPAAQQLAAARTFSAPLASRQQGDEMLRDAAELARLLCDSWRPAAAAAAAAATPSASQRGCDAPAVQQLDAASRMVLQLTGEVAAARQERDDAQVAQKAARATALGLTSEVARLQLLLDSKASAVSNAGQQQQQQQQASAVSNAEQQQQQQQEQDRLQLSQEEVADLTRTAQQQAQLHRAEVQRLRETIDADSATLASACEARTQDRLAHRNLQAAHQRGLVDAEARKAKDLAELQARCAEDRRAHSSEVERLQAAHSAEASAAAAARSAAHAAETKRLAGLAAAADATICDLRVKSGALAAALAAAEAAQATQAGLVTEATARLHAAQAEMPPLVTSMDGLRAQLASKEEAFARALQASSDGALRLHNELASKEEEREAALGDAAQRNAVRVSGLEAAAEAGQSQLLHLRGEVGRLTAAAAGHVASTAMLQARLTAAAAPHDSSTAVLQARLTAAETTTTQHTRTITQLQGQLAAATTATTTSAHTLSALQARYELSQGALSAAQDLAKRQSDGARALQRQLAEAIAGSEGLQHKVTADAAAFATTLRMKAEAAQALKLGGEGEERVREAARAAAQQRRHQAHAGALADQRVAHAAALEVQRAAGLAATALATADLAAMTGEREQQGQLRAAAERQLTALEDIIKKLRSRIDRLRKKVADVGA